VVDRRPGRDDAARGAVVQRLDSTRVDYMVEPFTNFFVSRVAKDLGGGATQIN